MKRCIVSRTLCRVCCYMMCACCFLVGKRVCAQKVATYLMDTAPSSTSFESHRISFSTSSKAVTVSFPLGGRHAFNVRAEYFRTASIPKLNEKVWDVKADWKFRAVPVTASYTYALPTPTSQLVPVLGAGVSVYPFKETHAAGYGSLSSPSPVVLAGSELNLQDSYGIKYGAELSLGLRTQVTPHLFLLAQGRYRYINCSAKSSIGNYGPGPVNVLDFSIDVGFGF